MGDASLLIAVQCGLVSNTQNANGQTFYFEADDTSQPDADVLKWVVFKLDNSSTVPAFRVEYYVEQAGRGFERIIEFKDGYPISSSDSQLGEIRQPLVRVKRKNNINQRQELSDTYIGSGQIGQENKLTLLSVRRILFFNKKIKSQRFPVLSIDAISGNPRDNGVQLLNGGKDPLIRFKLLLRCAISSDKPGSLPHLPERITITGVLSLSGQREGDETPRVKWGLFDVPERQGLAGILKSFRVANDQSTFANANSKLLYGATLEDVADKAEPEGITPEFVASRAQLERT